MYRNIKSSSRGFTLIELLVVVLILAILMAVALPLYLSAVADSEKKTCRANMQTIATAVQAAKVKSRSPDYSGYIGQTIDAAHEADLQSTPVCPSAGTYSLINGSSGSATTFKVSCTTHATFEPGVDSQ